MPIQQCEAGQLIYKAGDKSDVAYVVQAGQVEVTDVQGKKRVVDVGHIFGDVELVREVPRMESARALTAGMLRTCTAQELEALVYQAPGEIQQLVMHLVNQSASQAVVANKPVAAGASGTQEIGAFAQSLARVTQLLDERCTQLEQKISAGGAASSDEQDGSGSLPAQPRVGISRLREHMTEELVRELSNLGPINPLLEDDSINDILINGHKQVYIERRGKLELTNIQFADDEAVFAVAEKIVKTINRRIDPSRPLVDARLLDGSRVNIIAPPLAVDGTTISIRKFAKKKITLDVMLEQQNVSAQLAEFLRICGKVRLNIVISGGTGSGKTTLLNAVSQSISHDERIVTIEDAAELQLQQPHVVRLETKPITTSASTREEVSMRDLVKNALRMRPDRILVGEVRGPEAFDMMQAMNTGHEGSLTTVHANHPRDALSRLENMVAMANLNIPHSSIRYQIASAVNLIVQISRMRDGHRRITQVCEIVGMEGDIITMQDLFTYAVDGEDEKGKLRGGFRWTGIMPRFLRRVQYYGEAENLAKALGVKLPRLQ